MEEDDEAYETLMAARLLLVERLIDANSHRLALESRRAGLELELGAPGADKVHALHQARLIEVRQALDKLETEQARLKEELQAVVERLDGAALS
ncbi:hypothetical protein [Arboricoccus pini]|nr:hypothetical protein [Arboricoccus pini]